MRNGTQVGSGLRWVCGTAAIATLLLATSVARANPAPTCGYTAPYFANGTTGDVVAYPASSMTPILRTILADTGQSWGHVAMVSDASGAWLNESTWNGSNPSEGGCALPLDVWSLRNLSPGVSQQQAYGNNVTILKRGYGYCNYAYSTYKLASYGNRVANGNCAAYLTDSCGVGYYDYGSIYVGNAAADVYHTARSQIAAQVGWLVSAMCGGVGSEHMGDRGAMQILNEFFFGTGDQNYNYYANIQYPDENNHAAWAWPQYVNPGPTPDRIVWAHSGAQYTGQYAGSSYECSCPYGYAFNPSTWTCDPPTISYVRDNSTGAGWTAHPNSYIEIYGSGFSSSSNVVWLGTTNLTVTYNSPTQINAWVPSNVGGGSQSLQVTNPGVGSAFANLYVYGGCQPYASCSSYGYTCGQMWNGCEYETCGYYGGGCASGETCSSSYGGTCQAAASCSLSTNPYYVGVGQSYAFTLSTSVPGYVYWYGTKNGYWDAFGVYEPELSWTTYGTRWLTNPGGISGTYGRYAVITDYYGNTLCSTNWVYDYLY